MGIAVFDTDVLIAFRNREDAQHDVARDRMQDVLDRRAVKLVCAVNVTEVLVGPLRKEGAAGADRIAALLDRMRFEVVPADATLAWRAAEVRAETNLKLPDAYIVATALSASASEDDIRLESFDRDVIGAFQTLARHH